MQVFTSNQLQWRQKAVARTEGAAFREQLKIHGVDFVCSHASYLINLAAPFAVAARRSLAAFKAEMERCRRLGISHLVFHPGAHRGAGRDVGIARVIDRLNSVAGGDGPCLTVEITAGQGTCLGSTFEEVSEILRGLRQPAAVCIDTCHLLASGHEFRDESSYAATFDRIDRAIGLHRIAVFHINDSKGDIGSHLDRHAHIGDGRIGLPTFLRLLDDERFRSIPKILETPEGEKKDPMNLRRLRQRRMR